MIILALAALERSRHIIQLSYTPISNLFEFSVDLDLSLTRDARYGLELSFLLTSLTCFITQFAKRNRKTGYMVPLPSHQ